MTSSSIAFAGQNPTAPLAVNHFSLTILFNKALASSYNLLATSPTFSSVKMAGKLPCNSQAIKNGFQSMYSTSTDKSSITMALFPVKLGAVTWKALQSIGALFFNASVYARDCFVVFLLSKSNFKAV